jgi:hypothetical protein
VIESGFGSLDAFNMLVSGLFDQSAVKSSLRQGSKLRSPFNMAAGMQAGFRSFRPPSNLDLAV